MALLACSHFELLLDLPDSARELLALLTDTLFNALDDPLPAREIFKAASDRTALCRGPTGHGRFVACAPRDAGKTERLIEEVGLRRRRRRRRVGAPARSRGQRQSEGKHP